MVNYRYDQLQFSSVIPNFTNVGNVPGSIACSGTFPNLGGGNFTANLTLSTLNTFSDIYLSNQNTGKKTKLNNTLDIDLIWQYSSTETVQDSVSYLGSIVTIEISVFNGTGGTITLVNQTYSVEIIEYEIPI